MGEVHLRLQDTTGTEKLVRADVALSESVVFVTLNYEDRGYPILIENASDFAFTISQAVRHKFGVQSERTSEF